LVLLTFI